MVGGCSALVFGVIAGCGGSNPKNPAERYVARNAGYDVSCDAVGRKGDHQVWRCVGGDRDECWSLKVLGSGSTLNWGHRSRDRDVLKGCPPPTPEPVDTTPPRVVTHPATWYPNGFSVYDDNVAYKWILGNRCGYSSGRCWGIRVVSREGCPNGLYAEVNIVNGSTVVDYTNDSLGSLLPGYVAKLDFFTFRENPTLDAELTKLECY